MLMLPFLVLVFAGSAVLRGAGDTRAPLRASIVGNVLNAILAYSRMLQAGIITGDQQKRALHTVERNATVLSQIIEDVLDVSRIISGKIRLNIRPVDLPDVVKQAVETVSPAADAY